MWNGGKVGKVGTINIKRPRDAELELRVDLVLCSKKLCPGTTKTTMYRVLHLDVACAVYSVCVLWCIAALLCY